MVVIYAEKASLAKEIAHALKAGKGIALKMSLLSVGMNFNSRENRLYFVTV
jgi:hypothetical protein